MRHRWWRLLLALLVTASLSLSCGRGPDLSRPPEIRYGEDVCDQCRMIISEARFAAAYVTAAGDTRRFDDIGDMLAYMGDRHEDVAAIWVHDYETEAWLRAEEAHYVVSEHVHTPMGHGIVAFADDARAEAFAAEVGGQVAAWPELQAMGVGHVHP